MIGPPTPSSTVLICRAAAEVAANSSRLQDWQRIAMRGSKPGERRGGRQKGSLNKRTEEVQREAAKGGMLPLDYMLEVMRDKQEDPRRRDEMAKAAAPYVHPGLRLSTTQEALM